MFNLIGPAILALALASVVAWLELSTSKYPRTISLISKYWALYLYALVYGIVGFTVMLLLPLLSIKLEGPLVGNRWVQAAAIGLSTKALLHIRLFTISTGAQSVPFGIESLVHLFEPTCFRILTFKSISK